MRRTVRRGMGLLFVLWLAGCEGGAAGGDAGAGAGDDGAPPAADVGDGAGAEEAGAFFGRLGIGLDDLYWGEFHGHTNYSIDAALCGRSPGSPTPSPWEAYAWARDVGQLDFVALGDHDLEPNRLALPAEQHPLYGHCTALADGTRDPLWESLACIAQDFDEDGAFVVFPGWEYTNTPGVPCAGGSLTGHGHKNVIFRPLERAALPEARWSPACSMADVYAESAVELWERLAAYRPTAEDPVGRALTIIHTPANKGGAGHAEDIPERDDGACACEVPDGFALDPLDHSTDWDVVDPDFTRHVEIASKWGCSEGPPARADAECLADADFEYAPDAEGDPLTVRAQLQRRWLEDGDERYVIGFVGGTDGHDGHPGGDAVDVCDMAHRGAITGILAAARTRDALWTGLWHRHTVAASTGSGRLPLLFGVVADQDLLMGDLGTLSGPVRVHALAGPDVETLSLVVDGCVVRTVSGPALTAELTLDPTRRHVLYVRGSAPDDVPGQGDEHERRVWSSPVYLKPAP